MMKQIISLSAILLTTTAFAAENNLNDIANNINARHLRSAAAHRQQHRQQPIEQQQLKEQAQNNLQAAQKQAAADSANAKQ